MARTTAARNAAASSRKPSKNSAAKKAPAKKAPAKKATAKKATAKKATAKKATAKKSPAKKAPAKKAPAKKTPAKKTSAKKTPAKNRSANKAPAKKTSAKKTPAKKAPAKKTPAKKALAKKASGTTATRQRSQAGRLAVKSGEKPWTAKELRAVRAELDEDSARLRAELDAADQELAGLMRDAGDGAGNDQADVGSTTFERDHEMSLANNARDMLAQTERALGRIDDGTYGVCESCGQPIGKMRVMAFPRATLCLSCKQREERR
jgi:RNA polymerase-binding protein DksA